MDSNNQNFEENNNLLLSETEQEISIKVKTIDSNEYLVLTHKDSSISELKEKIQTVKILIFDLRIFILVDGI